MGHPYPEASLPPRSDHDRVKELLAANNHEVEKRRAAEARPFLNLKRFVELTWQNLDLEVDDKIAVQKVMIEALAQMVDEKL